MARDNFSALLAFVTVTREGSFTRAAAQLGVSQSALSHAIRTLETSLGIRLLTRTTRSVSPTEAGEHLFQKISGPMEEIDTEVQMLSEFRDKPSGTIRVTATDYAIRSILWPKVTKFLTQYPDIKVELICDYGLVDIAAQRYDAGGTVWRTTGARHDRGSPWSRRAFRIGRYQRLFRQAPRT